VAGGSERGVGLAQRHERFVIVIREVTSRDSAEVAGFLMETPIAAGTVFTFDRRPDFGALLRLRGTPRTFIAIIGSRIAGIVTAVWHDTMDGDVCGRVGEIADLRVANWARGGRIAFRLIQAVHQAFDDARVDWATCIIGDRNEDARGLVRGQAGLPSLQPLTLYVSVHFIAHRMRVPRPPPGIAIREAGANDGELVNHVVEESTKGRQLVSHATLAWPDSHGSHRAWLATDAHGRLIGGLVVWDGTGVRQIRVSRYSKADQTLRLLTIVAARFRIVAPLPEPGGVLHVWSSRWFVVSSSNHRVGRALVAAALRRAADEGCHVLQINLPRGDPLLSMLPFGARATYGSTLYGCALRASSRPASSSATYHADVALV